MVILLNSLHIPDTHPDLIFLEHSPRFVIHAQSAGIFTPGAAVCPVSFKPFLIRAVDNNDRPANGLDGHGREGPVLKGPLGVGFTLKRSHAGGTYPRFPCSYYQPPTVQMEPAELRQRAVLQ